MDRARRARVVGAGQLPRIAQRVIVVGGLAAFIAGVYVAVVLGVGSLLGTEAKPDRALAVVATLVVVVAFERVRRVVERAANRMGFGERVTPYEALAEFSTRVAATYVSEDALPRIAKIVTEGTGASRADVWIRTGRMLSPAASWPPSHDVVAPVALSGDELPDLGDAVRSLPIRHRGELLGAITVRKRSEEQVSGTEDRLLQDLASQAGLVLRNVGLTAELAARVDQVGARAQELRASRQRIVAAQDAARRRLERDIHDGAQQHLVALSVQLGLASTVAQQDPAQARAMVQGLRTVASDALETLRALARGIHPQILAERGIGEALRAHAGNTGLDVDVRAEGIRRYAPEVEAAVYFTCLEALQNAAKHAGVADAAVLLEETDGTLRFEVRDTGAGFHEATARRSSGLQNMADRVAAFGGELEIVSSPGSGTTIAGRIPVAGAV